MEPLSCQIESGLMIGVLIDYDGHAYVEIVCARIQDLLDGRGQIGTLLIIGLLLVNHKDESIDASEVVIPQVGMLALVIPHLKGDLLGDGVIEVAELLCVEDVLPRPQQRTQQALP